MVLRKSGKIGFDRKSGKTFPVFPMKSGKIHHCHQLAHFVHVVYLYIRNKTPVGKCCPISEILRVNRRRVQKTNNNFEFFHSDLLINL